MDNKIFDSKRIALGYAKRPWLHKNVMEQIKTDCNFKKNFMNGLDVGCGTGLSTKALKLICDKVTGTDISPEMIRVCNELYKNEEYEFYVAKAEETTVEEVKNWMYETLSSIFQGEAKTLVFSGYNWYLKKVNN